MEQKQYIDIFKALKHLAFYKDDCGNLHVESNLLTQTLEPLRMQSSEIENATQRYQKQVLTITINGDDYTKHRLDNNYVTKSMQKLNTLLDELQLEILAQLPHDRFPGSSYDKGSADVNDYLHGESEKFQGLILNKHNPFSDVSIKPQSYLYPNEAGKYSTLSFKTGYIINALNNNNIAAVPSFKIEAESNINTHALNAIDFDNSIATKLPRKSQGQTLYYL